MSVKNITPSLIKRVAPYRGARSSDSWNDTIDELATDIGGITSQWNTEIVPLLAGLPDGTVDANLNAFTKGLDGAQLYVDQNATVNTDNGEYWDIANSRPITTKETFDSIKSTIDNNYVTLTSLISDAVSGLTQEQKNAIGLEIFADDFVFSGVSMYTRGFTNQYNVQQLATDIYGGSVTPDGTGNPALTNSVKEMLGNLLLEHNGSWSGDAVVSHSIVNSDVAAGADIAQVKIDHSLVYNDSYAGVVANLEDDLNKLRTLVKGVKGTTAWDAAVSPGYSGGPTAMLSHLADHGTGVATATNPHGYKLEDIDQTNYLRDFTGQNTSDQNAPVYLSFNAISIQGASLETALNDIDDEIGTIQTGIAGNDTDIAELESFTGVDLTAAVFPDYGGDANYATGSLENAIELIDDVLFEAAADILVLEGSSFGADITALQGDVTDIRSFIGAVDGDTAPTYTSALIVTQSTPLESAVGELDSQLNTTNIAAGLNSSNLDSHVLDTGNPHAASTLLDLPHKYGYTSVVSGGPFLPTLEHWASDVEVEDFYAEFTESTVEMVLHEINSKVDEANVKGEGWNDLTVGGLAVETKGSDPPDLAELRNGMYLFAFAGTGATVEQAFTSFHILHDYKAGTKLYPHVHWTHNTATPSGDVHWQLDYIVAKGHDLGTFGAPTTITLTDTALPQYTHQIIETTEGNAISSTNIEPDTVILFRLYRDPANGSDTFENDAFLVQLDLHYESDGRKTNEKTSPFTKI